MEVTPHLKDWKKVFLLKLDSNELDEKRLKRLQQNRLSALKCRKKKKAQLNTLIDDKDKLSRENAALKDQVSALPNLNAFVSTSLTISLVGRNHEEIRHEND